MGNFLALLGGMGVGAAATYWLDPDSGRRRRAKVQDKVTHAVKSAEDSAAVAAKDMGNRIKGVQSNVQRIFTREQPGDDVIVNRVRSRLGHITSHAGAIHVTSDNGKVTLYGLALEDELPRILGEVAGVRGVCMVDNQLDVRKEPGDEPALQGETRTPASMVPFYDRQWTPAGRAAATTCGAVLCVGGVMRGGVLGWTGALLGAGLLAKAATNMPVSEVKNIAGRWGAKRRTFEFQESAIINAPVEECYNQWCNMEQFPMFMSHVKHVKQVGDNLYHWVVTGPVDFSVEWDARITENIPNQVIGWKSVGEMAIPNEGTVRFTLTEDGKTHVEVQLRYSPPGGALGQRFAEYLGADPGAQLRDDLQRFKSTLESRQAAAYQAGAAPGFADTYPPTQAGMPPTIKPGGPGNYPGSRS